MSDGDGSPRRSPRTQSPRSPARRLGNARLANALACSPVETSQQDEAPRSRASGHDEFDDDAHRMSVYVGTWNVGNTAPRMDAAKAWLAPARGHDIIAIAAQEASYAHSKHNISPKDVAATLSSGDDAVGDGHGTYATRRMGWLRSGKMTRFSGAVAGAAAGYYSSARVAEEMKVRNHWFDVVKAAVGPRYRVVQTAVLLQMRLIVLADESIADLITEVRVGYQATGILGAIGNKGGLMVRIELCHGRESMAFIATHLAAHEGEKHVRARNESLARIFAGCWEGSLVSIFFLFPLLYGQLD